MENVYAKGLLAMDSVHKDFHSANLATLRMKMTKYATMTQIWVSTSSTMAIVGKKVLNILHSYL